MSTLGSSNQCDNGGVWCENSGVLCGEPHVILVRAFSSESLDCALCYRWLMYSVQVKCEESRYTPKHLYTCTCPIDTLLINMVPGYITFFGKDLSIHL